MNKLVVIGGIILAGVVGAYFFRDKICETIQIPFLCEDNEPELLTDEYGGITPPREPGSLVHDLPTENIPGFVTPQVDVMDFTEACIYKRCPECRQGRLTNEDYCNYCQVKECGVKPPGPYPFVTSPFGPADIERFYEGIVDPGISGSLNANNAALNVCLIRNCKNECSASDPSCVLCAKIKCKQYLYQG